MLSFGSLGPDVTRLQLALKAAGCDPGGADGVFGPGTRAAVTAFQRANRLPADGVVGPQTDGVLARYHRDAFDPATGPSTRPGTQQGGRYADLDEAVRGQGAIVQRGDGGPGVGQLQDRLTKLGYGVARTSEFGPQTESLVKKFQADHQVQQTGKVGPTTLDALEKAELGQPLDAAVANGRVLGRDSQGKAVQELQARLASLGYPLDADGLFGPGTEAAVKRFQADHKVAQTGQVGKTTLGALRGANGTPTTPTPGAASGQRSLGAPVLCQYDSGSYPGGYCAITALRMTLRLEGKHDPGADAVALQGSHPYSPGSGSSGSLLAARARELGLPGARYTTNGSLDDVKRELARGHAVPIGGEGRFVGTLADGSGRVWDHSYNGSGHWMAAVGYDEARRSFIVNDPDRGARMYVKEADFARFFAPDGPRSAWMITY